MPAPTVVALVVGDLHLSHRPPIARSLEPDWYAAMARSVEHLRQAQEKYNVPIVCAGDIFDTWRSPPELINWAIEQLPCMFAVPGQHDLPYHSYEDIHKSPYWSLVLAGKLINLKPGKVHTPRTENNRLRLHGFPWGTPVVPNTLRKQGWLDIAVVHSYVWVDKCGFPGADETKRASQYLPQLEGYDLGVFGDNHKGFSYGKVYNCGGFMRRKTDESAYSPSYGKVYSDGSVERQQFPTFADAPLLFPPADQKNPMSTSEMMGFVEVLNELRGEDLDFTDLVKRLLEKNEVGSVARQMILSALESSDAS